MDENQIDEEALFSNDPESELFPSLLERMLLIYAALVIDTEEEEMLNDISDAFETDFHDAETRLLDFEQKLIERHYREANIAELEFFPDEEKQVEGKGGVEEKSTTAVGSLQIEQSV